MITFLRRRALGAGSLRGVCGYLNSVPASSVGVRMYEGCEASVLRNNLLSTPRGIDLVSQSDLIVRWGVTTPCGSPINRQVNPSAAVKFVNNKAESRMVMSEAGLAPVTMTNGMIPPFGLLATSTVLRPTHHAQGRNLFVINGEEELFNVLDQHRHVFREGWYLSTLVDKVAEYRVYVVNGRVATVARKTPSNPDAVAWNVAQGGRFDVVPWGDWPLEACRVATEAFKLCPNLDFGGVDVMVDGEGKAWVIEINSAPSLPLLSDGSISYRQKCMAKTFKWMVEHGRETMGCITHEGWRGYIHPAIREYND